MSSRKSFCECALLLLLVSVTSARGAVLSDESAAAVKSGARVVVPEVYAFSIATQGVYRVTLTDVGISPAQSPKLIVTRGLDVVARIETATSPQNTVDVTLTPGSYVLRMAGRAPAGSASQLNALVAQDTTALASHSIGLVPLPPDDLTVGTVQTTFAIAQAGTYAVELLDRVLPAAFASLQLTVVSNGVPVICIPANPTACPGVTGNSFVAAPGQYQLFVLARTQVANPAGLFSLRIADQAAGNIAYAQTHAIGAMTSVDTIALPAAATYALTGVNHALPTVALSQLHIALVQDANAAVLRSISTSASTLFAANGGDAQLYVYAKPDATANAGSYGVEIKQDAQAVWSDLRAVNVDTPSVNEAFNFRVTLPTSGPLQVIVKDFDVPPLGALKFAVIQGGVLLQSADMAGTLNVSATAGEIDIAVLATARQGDAIAKGLFGVTATVPASTTSLFECTQGVGGLFHSRNITVTASRRYEASFVDQRFPSPFTELQLVLTRGATLVSSIYAAGGVTPTSTTFDVTAGEYTINLLAASGSDNYGLYGLRLSDVTPEPPAQPTPTTNAASGVTENGGGATSPLLLIALAALAFAFRTRALSQTR